MRDPEPPSAEPQTILLVEDHDGLRLIIARFLTSDGFRVIAVGDGAAAIAALSLSHQPIDLLLTDLHLPDMHGRVVADQAIMLRPGLPILFASGSGGDAETNRELVGMGARMLPKPFLREELLVAVKAALSG